MMKRSHTAYHISSSNQPVKKFGIISHYLESHPHTTGKIGIEPGATGLFALQRLFPGEIRFLGGPCKMIFKFRAWNPIAPKLSLGLDSFLQQWNGSFGYCSDCPLTFHWPSPCTLWVNFFHLVIHRQKPR